MRNRSVKFSCVPIGIVKASILLIIPLSVFLFEAVLHLSIITLDYEERELKMVLNESTKHIEELKATVAELESLERIDAQAPQLGLVTPEPGQIVSINSREPENFWLELEPFDIASGNIVE